MIAEQNQVVKCGWLSEVRFSPVLKLLQKRVWCVLLGSELKCYKSDILTLPPSFAPQQHNPKILTTVNLEFYRTVSIPSKTSGPSRSFRIEPIRTSTSTNLDQKARTFRASSSDEAEDWIEAIHKRLGGRNIVDVALDRLALSSGGSFSRSSTPSLRSRCSNDSLSTMSTGSSTVSKPTKIAAPRSWTITSTDPRCDSLFDSGEESLSDEDEDAESTSCADSPAEILVVWEEVDVAQIERKTTVRRPKIAIFDA
ncbi:hypothetical protein BC936DRAFT_138448 [Jimgerdemannia flammicorona]|uniref:PH domain-containing protein n=1 Tax=Jimgerdemannia flammicorona TaxID=994334 RepID=A0A433CEQ3_9FUNG|nr:hypothetical protein BC936DRAFT_138448 [Jimgerdemannia flammicorona]